MADLDFAAKMERELQMAAEVQWSMLPAAVPEVPNYSFWACWEPALPVGGDMYEFCRLPTGEILVVVADVGGKGLAAAIGMAALAGVVPVLWEQHSPNLTRFVSA